MKIRFFIMLLMLVIALNTDCKESDDVNYLELASLMIKDDNLDRAEVALSQINLEDEELDLQRFYVISALLNVKRNNHQQTIEFIQKAKQLGKVEAVMDVYLAQAAYSTEDYQLAINALDSAGADIAKIPSIYHMKSQSYWNLQDSVNAIAVLEQAEKIFPQDGSFPRRKVFYYIELGYNKEAMELGQSYLNQFEGKPEDFIAIGNAIKSTGDNENALEFLEKARLQYPHNLDINKSLAAVYINEEKYLSAARIIHEASFTNSELTKEAAELYRRSGNVFLALSLNSLIENQTEKLKQRLSILIQMENFEQAAAMEEDLLRTRTIADDNIKYALAYSFFNIGNYTKTEDYLSQITSSDLLSKVVELRKFIDNCRPQPWTC